MGYGLHSDIDGDLHLHSDEPGSDLWIVEAVWPPSTEYALCDRTRNWSTYGVTHARNAWYVDGASTIRITDNAGNSMEHTVHPYPSVRAGDWDWARPRRSTRDGGSARLNRARWGVILPRNDDE